MTDQLIRAEVDESAPRRDPSRAPAWAGPVAGLAAGAVAVCIGMLVAAMIDVVSPIDAVGSEVIDRVPKWLKQQAIDWFGTNDKLALRVGIVSILAGAAAIVGALARRRPVAGIVGISLFGVVGALAAAHRPGESWTAALPALSGAVIGCALLWFVIRDVRAADGPGASPTFSRPLGWDRRRFVVTTGGAAAVAVVATASARRLEDRRIDRLRDAAPDELPAVSPAAASTAPTVPAGAQLSPTTPYLTPNDDFYLIDTALSVPRIRLDRWTVEIGGMVATPITLDYDQLLARPQVERIITLACVSNEVGGNLIGNAVWQGVLLADLFDEAGVDPRAEQVFSTSVDGWTCGFPVGIALDGRDAMIALGMNGEPLPLQHGFPARLVVPGLYGYVSATKWLQRIELTTWDAAEGYWVPRGWSRDGPVKTQSRIDVPRRGDTVPVGPTAIAGIAWAQHRGIERVELSIDGGEWVEAGLATDVTDDSWRQWLYEWGATPGDHAVRVRATDKTGETQTEEVSRVDPDGATGWHTRKFTVEG